MKNIFKIAIVNIFAVAMSLPMLLNIIFILLENIFLKKDYSREKVSTGVIPVTIFVSIFFLLLGFYFYDLSSKSKNNFVKSKFQQEEIIQPITLDKPNKEKAKPVELKAT